MSCMSSNCSELVSSLPPSSLGLAQTNVRIPSGNDVSTANNEHQLIPDRNPELIHNPALNNDTVGHPDTDNDTAASLPETHEESVHVYHPSSGWPTQIVHFKDYRLSSTFQHVEPPIDTHPWRPFASRCDFELAEFILNAALTKKQMKTLFELLNLEAASNRSTEFNIRSPKDFKEHWDRAVNLITPFEKSTAEFVGMGTGIDPEPSVRASFHWDAVQLSKWNGDAFEKFVDEPWMAQAFWDLQTALPGGAKVFCFIIYADKTRLSSFGIAQAYPVVACCGNLPIKIQNRNGVSGGRVVRWLPVIKEEAKFKKKVYYIDFKHRVWHAAFKYIIEPLNFIVLIRGINGLKPCVICLVPKLEQYNLDIRYELWTKHQTQEILADAAAIPTKGAQNKFLSGFGLRNIENVFWNIEECDPFRSLSFDPLHAHNNGLFGDHLRGELVSRIGALGRESVGQADNQIKLFPRWRNLYHFESGFMAVHFADGTKYEDLSKHIMFVTHNILTEDNDEHGYHLLKCVRSYVELHMYAGFNLHTEHSIQAIWDELLKFSVLIREYEQLTRSTDPGAKLWNFPKVHSHQHMVDDILWKGVMLNYNMKPNEKMHGPLKDAYRLRTNFKDIAEQILRVDSWCNAASFICQQIDLHKEQLKTPDNDDDMQSFPSAVTKHINELEEDTSKVSEYSGKVTLHGHHGKGGGVFKIREIRDLRADDPAFHGFRTHLSEFMIQQFRKYPNIIPKVDREKVSFKSFKPDEEIQLYGLLKVNYENMIDWTTSTDYLQCSLNFYNHP
ncbi:hypothetical protein EDD18DRAFT_1358011 [Armillaria luteobubalina]|uniref:Uncharacterized protein n=1 Tax=Armillaria luteobubalina TaxID=153913 RepID=A0AA39PXP6_9AGAR|nr:hypothetical protein EDD18DRAFT_1358011 [Armillaria luteobubalina]